MPLPGKVLHSNTQCFTTTIILCSPFIAVYRLYLLISIFCSPFIAFVFQYPVFISIDLALARPSTSSSTALALAFTINLFRSHLVSPRPVPPPSANNSCSSRQRTAPLSPIPATSVKPTSI
ncbi:unnamed protein product [Periconia digitata]|uniref:Uncharacterized protein n=1 Tax=Periconia digitata TaxID=1303443 RepID=A0A9W4XZ87_9PLEO|nr:unnamed protein product [Periconia digitata]